MTEFGNGSDSQPPPPTQSESVDVVAAELQEDFDQVRIIASGATSTVVDAIQRTTGRPVAVKLMRWRDVTTIPLRDPEVQALVSLSWHPHIATLIDAGVTANGRLWLCMELASTTLAERLGRHPLEPVELLRIATELTSAVAAVHSKSIIHSDLKPSNVLLAQDGGVRVADFGIARLLQLPAPTIDIPRGTAQYISPEALEGGQTTAASDVWGIGVTLWAAAHGRPPFGGDDQPLASVLHAASDGLHDWNPPPSFVGPEADRIREVVLECTRSDPMDRPSAAEVSAILARPVRQPAIAGSSRGVGRGRGRWAIVALVASIVTGVTAVRIRDDREPIIYMPPKEWCRANELVSESIEETLRDATASLDAARPIDAPHAVLSAIDTVSGSAQKSEGQLRRIIANEPTFRDLKFNLRPENFRSVIFAEAATFAATGRSLGIGEGRLDDKVLNQLPGNVARQARALEDAAILTKSLCDKPNRGWITERERFGASVQRQLIGPFFQTQGANPLTTNDLTTLDEFLAMMIRIQPRQFVRLALDHPDWIVQQLGRPNFVDLLTKTQNADDFGRVAAASREVSCFLRGDPSVHRRLQEQLSADLGTKVLRQLAKVGATC